MDKRPLAPEDIFSLKCFGDVRLSPAGDIIAFVRQHHDREKEKSFTDIFLHSVLTGGTRQLTNSGKDRGPRWSPDGKRLAFTSERSGKAQVWIIDPTGGEAWRIPTKEAVQGDITWSPDGKKIFFTSNAFAKADDWQPYPGAPADDRARATEQAQRALKPRDEKAKDDKSKSDGNGKPNNIKVITRLRYRLDGVGYFGDLRKQVYWVEVPSDPPGEADLTTTRLTSGDHDHNLPAVTPHGRYAILSALRLYDSDYETKSDLWLFEVQLGKAMLLYDSPGPVNNPQISPDGKFVAFFGHDRARGVSTRTDLFVLPIGAFLGAVDGGETPAPLTPKDAANVSAHLDRAVGSGASSEPRYSNIGGLVWQGDTIYFLLQDHGEVFVYKAELRLEEGNGDAPESCARPGSWHVSKVFGSEGKALGGFDVKDGVFAYQSSTPTTPEDVFMRKDEVETRITIGNDEFVKGLAIGNAEKFQYRAKDGQELDGWIVYPYGYEAGKKYPLVLQVHGGPHGSYSSAFMFSAQLFASRGYAVAYCNPRGSTSYGQEFMAVIDGDWGNKDYGDVMSCVDAVVERGIADENNLFIHGWSYGGYMTTWVVTQTDRFRAACAGACVANLHSDYGTSDIMWSDEHEYGGKPWEDAAHLLDRSALSHVQNVTTPILLLHGEGDLRCPISQSEQFYIGLKRLQKTAVFVRYPEEYHGLRRHLHRIDRFKRMIAWFEHHRRGEPV